MGWSSLGSRVSPSSTGILWTKVPPGGPKGIPKRGRWASPSLASALGISSRRACPVTDGVCARSPTEGLCMPAWPTHLVQCGLGQVSVPPWPPASFCQVSELATWAAFWHL